MDIIAFLLLATLLCSKYTYLQNSASNPMPRLHHKERLVAKKTPYFNGLDVSTVPLCFAVSGPPEPLVDFSLPGSSICTECRVSVLDKPFCFDEMSPGELPDGLLCAGYVSVSHTLKRASKVDSQRPGLLHR